MSPERDKWIAEFVAVVRIVGLGMIVAAACGWMAWIAYGNLTIGLDR